MRFFKFIFFSIILFVSTQTYAQSDAIDSLRNLISTTNIDTTKVNSLNELGQKLIRVDLANAMDTINLSIDIAKTSEYNKGLALAFKIKGILYYYQGEVDTSLIFFYKSLNIHEQSGNLVEEAKMYNNIGIILNAQGKLSDAIFSYLQAIELLKNTDEKATLVTIYINASNVFRNIGDYERALNFNYNALKIISEYKEKTTDDSLQIGHIYKSIANIYTDQNNYFEAKKNYNLALDIYQKINSSSDIGDIYLNLGVMQTIPKKESQINMLLFDVLVIPKNSDSISYSIARKYYLKAPPFYQNKSKIATADLNIGEAYHKTKIFDSAEIYLNKALKINLELGDNRGISLTYAAFGDFYNKQKKYEEAIKVLSIALDTAKIVGDINILLVTSEGLYEALSNTKNYEKALEMHELFKKMNDSIFNNNNERELTQVSMSFEFEKEQEKTELKHQEEIKRQKIVKYFSFAMLFLVVLILISVFYSLRTKKRKNDELKIKNEEILQQNEEIIAQSEEINVQKEEIEKKSKAFEKQRDIAIERGDKIEIQKKDIEASIRYALRIQEAIMPTFEPLKQNFSDFFVFFRPRDIVSGDFYWINQKGNKIITVASDCTGHGVPGAFMSMLGISFLNQIVSELNNVQSDVILNKLREMIITSLKQDADDSDSSRDGMDIAVTVFDTKTNQIQYSGAYNSMYIISDREIDYSNSAKKTRIFSLEKYDKKIFEIKADRMPIGVFIGETKPFSNHTIQLEKGDRFYIFSDGYHDLYDRKNNKKFTTKRYKELLLSTSNLKMKKQEKVLEKTYINWCGDYKQVDDIIVIGVEI